ncbi:lysophospholipid acyltransferase family protein [Aureispira anguillae]|uniref:Glycerol acyltransferase n=1 Tax=Aureispira anguillae TaxID=2864201 RepID=A0A916DSI3_9BACT|nr:glycerol acyltransferase [Aureispira anguillae]BDS10826.1 glycerol acyltransferase [Aureispira anguillae]
MTKNTASNTITTKKKRVYTQEEIDANKFIYDHFDANYVRQINNALFKIVEETYFRPVYIGFDEMPERNNPAHPIILASNHSGMAFPWDAMVFGCGMLKRFNYDENKIFRAIIAPGLSGIPAMHPFYMKGSWKVSGGVDATFLNFETMMQYPKGHLLIYPEGVPGIGKGFNRKYQLQRFATSFIRMSLKYKTDILPYSTVNAEYVVPYVYSFDFVNRQFNKIGVPFMALGVLTVALVFPWAFYLAFPVKMHFVRGTRISPYKWIDKPYEELTEAEISDIRDRVKAIMQKDLDAAVEKYGQAPFQVKELIKVMWQKRQYFPYNLPLFWPLLFHEFERQWLKERKYETQEPIEIGTGWGTFLRLIWRNPITIAYFIPIIGWFILTFYGNKKWKKLDELGKPFK